MAGENLPKVLVIGELTLPQEKVLKKLIALEKKGLCEITYREVGTPTIIFDPKEIDIDIANPTRL